MKIHDFERFLLFVEPQNHPHMLSHSEEIVLDNINRLKNFLSDKMIIIKLLMISSDTKAPLSIVGLTSTPKLVFSSLSSTIASYVLAFPGLLM